MLRIAWVTNREITAHDFCIIPPSGDVKSYRYSIVIYGDKKGENRKKYAPQGMKTP